MQAHMLSLIFHVAIESPCPSRSIGGGAGGQEAGGAVHGDPRARARPHPGGPTAGRGRRGTRRRSHLPPPRPRPPQLVLPTCGCSERSEHSIGARAPPASTPPPADQAPLQLEVHLPNGRHSTCGSPLHARSWLQLICGTSSHVCSKWVPAGTREIRRQGRIRRAHGR